MLDARKLALETVDTDIRKGVLSTEVLDWKLVPQRSAQLGNGVRLPTLLVPDTI